MDIIIVIGHEKLTIELQRLLPALNVIQLPKSGGVVELDDTYREIAHAAQVRSYFYGEPGMVDRLVGRVSPMGLQLSPYSFQIGWELLRVLRVGGGSAAPSSALPLGSTNILSPTRLTRVDPAGPAHVVRLLNTVLAIVNIREEDKIEKEGKEGEDVKEEVKEEEEEADEEDDEVPFREEIGWREVLGFVVM